MNVLSFLKMQIVWRGILSPTYIMENTHQVQPQNVKFRTSRGRTWLKIINWKW